MAEYIRYGYIGRDAGNRKVSITLPLGGGKAVISFSAKLMDIFCQKRIQKTNKPRHVKGLFPLLGYGAVPVPAITTLQHQVAGQLFVYFPVTVSADVLSPPVFTGKMVLTAADSPLPGPVDPADAGPVAGNNGFAYSQALSCNIGCDTVYSGSGCCGLSCQDNPES